MHQSMTTLENEYEKEKDHCEDFKLSIDMKLFIPQEEIIEEEISSKIDE